MSIANTPQGEPLTMREWHEQVYAPQREQEQGGVIIVVPPSDHGAEE